MNIKYGMFTFRPPTRCGLATVNSARLTVPITVVSHTVADAVASMTVSGHHRLLLGSLARRPIHSGSTTVEAT